MTFLSTFMQFLPGWHGSHTLKVEQKEDKEFGARDNFSSEGFYGMRMLQPCFSGCSRGK